MRAKHEPQWRPAADRRLPPSVVCVACRRSGKPGRPRGYRRRCDSARTSQHHVTPWFDARRLRNTFLCERGAQLTAACDRGVVPSPDPQTASEPTFGQASRDVLTYLREHVPMAFWAVTRVENGRQTYLYVEDDTYGLRPGGFHEWSESFCIHMASGSAPRVAPDAQQVQAYAAAGVNDAIDIGAYAGAEIHDADGGLFGAICGLDPQVQGDELTQVAPLLVLLSRLLTHALAADRHRQESTARALEAELAADTDSLTGVYSRRAWERLVSDEAYRFDRLADPTAVVIIDLDGLKRTNDEAGHAAGDELLIAAAAAIRAAVRAHDPVARLGGDEFGVLLRQCTAEAATGRAAAIRDALQARGVLASVGVAAAVPGQGLRAAVQVADRDMYAAKRSGRPPAGSPRQALPALRPESGSSTL